MEAASVKWVEIIITQFICVAVILVAIFVCKYFFEGEYLKTQKWYEQNICNDTHISEVLPKAEEYIDEI